MGLQGIGITALGVEVIDEPGCTASEAETLRAENKELSRRLADDNRRYQDELSSLRHERTNLTIALNHEHEKVAEACANVSRLEGSLASLGAQHMRRQRRREPEVERGGWSIWSAIGGVTW